MRIFTKAGLVALIVCMASFTAYAARAPKSAVFGSAHDFKSKSEFSPGGASFTLCNFCHIAHRFCSAPTVPGYFLWNHTLSNLSTYGVYTRDSILSIHTEL